MSRQPLQWRELAQIGRWLVKGPRALVSSAEPTGGSAGWLDRMAHWEKRTVAAGIQQSCTIFRRFEYEGAALPEFVVRFANWDAASDREASKGEGASGLTVSVQHFQLPAALAAFDRDEELATAVGASAVRRHDDSEKNPVTLVYDWTLPGRRIAHSLHWMSAPETASLERLWEETKPKAEGLQVHAGLIERFDIEVFGEYLDASIEQLATVHHLM